MVAATASASKLARVANSALAKSRNLERRYLALKEAKNLEQTVSGGVQVSVGVATGLGDAVVQHMMPHIPGTDFPTSLIGGLALAGYGLYPNKRLKYRPEAATMAAVLLGCEASRFGQDWLRSM